MPGRRQQTGRIRTCDRNTNDTIDLLVDDVAIVDARQVMVRNTEKLEINVRLYN